MEWMTLPLKRYADFQGRSRRKEYWMFALLNILVMLVPLVLIFSAVPMGEAAMESAIASGGIGVIGWIGFALVGIWALVIFIPSIAVTVRRLHDRDMSGWWYLGAIVASFIPVVGFIANIALLVLMVLPGTAGANRFGPDPKDPAQASVFE